MNEKKDLMKMINAYAFAAYDWNLYLDTHPDDTDAIAMFKKMSDIAKELKKSTKQNSGL